VSAVQHHEGAAPVAASAVAPGDIAIDVRNVSKRFKLYRNMVLGPLKDLLFFWRKGTHYREFRAVHDVSFQVRRGEVVGIVGPNGAGKTTLLKMIAKLLPIDSGSIEVRGRVNALLALGVGVHPEFTGRENIYYGALMLGMKAAEIEAKMDSIIEFAELGDFIEQPFRTYSSGMRSRLLFSISMSIEPDILIVDEALATGDAYFVQKCAKRIRELCTGGATILFVSHNLTQIEEMCERAIFIAEGRVIHQGDPQSVIRAYNTWTFEREKGHAKSGASEELLPPVGGNGQVVVEDVRLTDRSGQIVSGIYTGDQMTIEIDYASDLPSGTKATCFIGLVRASDKQWVGEINSRYYFDPHTGEVSQQELTLWPRGTVTVIMDPVLLLNNHYNLWIQISDKANIYAEYRGVGSFFVARQAHVFDRAPVFWQPCRFSSLERVSSGPVTGFGRSLLRGTIAYPGQEIS
jgi:ABC-type polysaccharide/polyol phosphate transport system ATPase subunit